MQSTLVLKKKKKEKKNSIKIYITLLLSIKGQTFLAKRTEK